MTIAYCISNLGCGCRAPRMELTKGIVLDCVVVGEICVDIPLGGIVHHSLDQLKLVIKDKTMQKPSNFGIIKNRLTITPSFHRLTVVLKSA